MTEQETNDIIARRLMGWKKCRGVWCLPGHTLGRFTFDPLRDSVDNAEMWARFKRRNYPTVRHIAGNLWRVSALLPDGRRGYFWDEDLNRARVSCVVAVLTY